MKTPCFILEGNLAELSGHIHEQVKGFTAVSNGIVCGTLALWPLDLQENQQLYKVTQFYADDYDVNAALLAAAIRSKPELGDI